MGRVFATRYVLQSGCDAGSILNGYIIGNGCHAMLLSELFSWRWFTKDMGRWDIHMAGNLRYTK